MAVLFMQREEPATDSPLFARAWRTSPPPPFHPLSLRIPFFYHLASPLPVEASSYIQRSKSCWFLKSERLHKMTKSDSLVGIDSFGMEIGAALPKPRARFLFCCCPILRLRFRCPFILFNFSSHLEAPRRKAFLPSFSNRAVSSSS